MTDAKHEAPASTFTISRAEYETLKAGYPGDPSLLHEAPAEGAGEIEGLKRRIKCLEKLAGEQSLRVMQQATRAKDAENELVALRAQPQAREEAQPWGWAVTWTEKPGVGLVSEFRAGSAHEEWARSRAENEIGRPGVFDVAAFPLYTTPPAPEAEKLRPGEMHTIIMDRIHEELIRQHPDAFTEDGDIERIIPSGCTPQSAFVKIDVSALADVALAALQQEVKA